MASVLEVWGCSVQDHSVCELISLAGYGRLSLPSQCPYSTVGGGDRRAFRDHGRPCLTHCEVRTDPWVCLWHLHDTVTHLCLPPPPWHVHSQEEMENECDDAVGSQDKDASIETGGAQGLHSPLRHLHWLVMHPEVLCCMDSKPEAFVCPWGWGGVVYL